MAAATSLATGHVYGVRRVCAIWAWRDPRFTTPGARRDGRPRDRPVGAAEPALGDADLLAASSSWINQVERFFGLLRSSAVSTAPSRSWRRQSPPISTPAIQTQALPLDQDRRDILASIDSFAAVPSPSKLSVDRDF